MLAIFDCAQNGRNGVDRTASKIQTNERDREEEKEVEPRQQIREGGTQLICALQLPQYIQAHTRTSRARIRELGYACLRTYTNNTSTRIATGRA